MNYIIVLLLAWNFSSFLTLIPILAQSFLRPQGVFMNISIPFLARNFGSSARLLPLATPESYNCTSRISQRQVTQQLTKITAKNKTKPFQSQTKPFFWRSNLTFSPKMRIFDKFRQTFLCKTKPFLARNFASHCHSGLDPESILSCPSCTSWPKSKTNPKRTQTNPIFPRPNPILSLIMGIFDKFRKTFLCKTNPIQIYLMNNINPILAQSFLRPQGLGSAESGYVLLYIEHFGLCRKRRDRNKESPKYNAVEYELLKNIKYTKQSQFGN